MNGPLSAHELFSVALADPEQLTDAELAEVRAGLSMDMEDFDARR